MERLTKNNDTQYDFIGNYNSNIDEFRFNKKLRNDVLNKIGELEDFIEEIDSATIIYKDGIATFHIDMVLTNETIEIVKKYFNCKEIER